MRFKPFFHAVATLSGLILGVGIFGVPYVSAKAGISLALFWIIFLGAVTLFVHYLYGQLIMSTPGKHRLAGYIQGVLGNRWKKATIVIDIIQLWGIQLVYIIVGGKFLSIMLSPYIGGSVFAYSVIIFVLISLITFFGLRLVDRIEFFMTWILVGAFLIIITKGIPYIDISNILAVSTTHWFLPYGVILASMSGSAALPEIWDITKRRKKEFIAAIIVGTLIPIAITILFTFVVVGVSGDNTSEEAIAGLQGILGNGIVYFGAFMGLFAIVTSYLVIALYLQETLKYDFLLKHTPAWVSATWIPFVVFLIGAQNFIQVMDTIGSILVGAGAALLVVASIKVIKKRKKKSIWIYIVGGFIAVLLFTIGFIQKIIDLIIW